MLLLFMLMLFHVYLIPQNFVYVRGRQFLCFEEAFQAMKHRRVQKTLLRIF